jgi:ABC-type nickel/cobalt efflux system permease component RcnA
MTVTLTGALLGIVLGARHALEPDHLAAVAVLAADSPGVRRGAWLGAIWGIGHSLSLFAVGLLLTLTAAVMPDRLADVFELGVAVMLMVLGARAVARSLREGRVGPRVHHHHHGGAHAHEGPHAHLHVGRWTFAQRPLLIGLVHGLAGSGALTALVFAELPSHAARLLFMALFGFGSALGMAVVSGLAGFPLARLGRDPRTARAVFAAAGLMSAVFGAFWGWPLVQRLLS